MPPSPPPLLLLHSDPVLRDRIRRAAGRSFQVEGVESWTALHEAVRTAPPASVAVVDPYAGSAAGMLSPHLPELLAAYPLLPVIAVLDTMPRQAEDIRTFDRWGVIQVVLLGEDDTEEALALRLDSVRTLPLQRLVQQTLPPRASGRARAIVLAAAEVVFRGGDAKDLARALGISVRTLPRWCERAGLPVPRRLLVWIRILYAARLLDDPERTVQEAALAAGYASDVPFRKALRDLLGLGPTPLREQGAFSTAAEAFRAELAQARSAATVKGGATRRR